MMIELYYDIKSDHTKGKELITIVQVYPDTTLQAWQNLVDYHDKDCVDASQQSTSFMNTPSFRCRSIVIDKTVKTRWKMRRRKN